MIQQDFESVAAVMKQVGSVAWDAALRQAYLEATLEVLYIAAVASAIFLWVKYVRRYDSFEEMMDENFPIGIAGVFLAIFALFAVYGAVDVITVLANPNYAAMHQLGQVVSGN